MVADLTACYLSAQVLGQVLVRSIALSSREHSPPVSAFQWGLIGHAEAPADSDVCPVDQLRDSCQNTPQAGCAKPYVLSVLGDLPHIDTNACGEYKAKTGECAQS